MHMAAGGTHSLICGALWHTVVARHNAMTQASLRIAARGRIAATREPYVKQLAQQPCAVGLPALPTFPLPAPSAGKHMPARASFAAPGSPHPIPNLAASSTLDSAQAPHPPIPSATAAYPLGRDCCRTLRSRHSRRGLLSCRSRCGPCPCCAESGSGNRNARNTPLAYTPRNHFRGATGTLQGCRPSRRYGMNVPQYGERLCSYPRLPAPPHRIDTSRRDHTRMTFALPKDVFSARSIMRESE